MHTKDEGFTIELKKYIRKLFATEMTKKGPILSIKNSEVTFLEAVEVFKTFLNSSHMYKSRWGKVVLKCIDREIINPFGCIEKVIIEQNQVLKFFSCFGKRKYDQPKEEISFPNFLPLITMENNKVRVRYLWGRHFHEEKATVNKNPLFSLLKNALDK